MPVPRPSPPRGLRATTRRRSRGRWRDAADRSRPDALEAGASAWRRGRRCLPRREARAHALADRVHPGQRRGEGGRALRPAARVGPEDVVLVTDSRTPSRRAARRPTRWSTRSATDLPVPGQLVADRVGARRAEGSYLAVPTRRGTLRPWRRTWSPCRPKAGWRRPRGEGTATKSSGSRRRVRSRTGRWRRSSPDPAGGAEPTWPGASSGRCARRSGGAGLRRGVPGGPEAALPHGSPGDGRSLEAVLLFDFGAQVEGYRSDCPDAVRG